MPKKSDEVHSTRAVPWSRGEGEKNQAPSEDSRHKTGPHRLKRACIVDQLSREKGSRARTSQRGNTYGSEKQAISRVKEEE